MIALFVENGARTRPDPKHGRKGSPMPISISCPQCGKTYQLHDELAGKRAKCKCGQTFVVPEPVEELPSASDPPSDRLEQKPLDRTTSSSAPIGLPPKQKDKRKPLRIVVIAVELVAAVLAIAMVVYVIAEWMESPKDVVTRVVSPAPIDLVGYATPLEAFAAREWANNTQDWKAMLLTYTSESQDRLAGGLARDIHRMASFDTECAELVTKHGLDELLRVEKESLPKLDDDRKAQAERDGKLGSALRDKSAFYVDANSRVAAMRKESNEKRRATVFARYVEQMEQIDQAQRSATLTNVLTHGDNAQGRRCVFVEGRSLITPVQFRRINGRWYMHDPIERGSADE